MFSNQLPLPAIDRKRCIGCGNCIAVCPTNALGQVAEQAALVDPAACIWCACCEEICPTDAIGLPYLISFHDTPPQTVDR
jgi:ferredoxin